MDCDFTEEVSLLVDGELAPREAARLGAHMEGCAACRQARESFLLLRQELRSYDRAPDPDVQSAALASILDAPTRPAGRGSGLWGSLAEALGARSLRPAPAVTLALLLTATALGLLWLKGAHTSRPEAPAAADTNGPPAQTAAKGGEERSESADDVDRQPFNRPKEATPQLADIRATPQRMRKNARVRRDDHTRTKPQGREGLSRELPREVARVAEPTLPPPQASAFAAYAAVSLRAADDDDPSLRVGRHAERLERLLRSFRNARLTKGDPTLDVAEARRLSRRLLYSNIALRREAAGAGDLPVEGLLDSVEPILIDISNLPDDPSAEAVGSIKERIGRRRLVGALQAQGMQVSR